MQIIKVHSQYRMRLPRHYWAAAFLLPSGDLEGPGKVTKLWPQQVFLSSRELGLLDPGFLSGHIPTRKSLPPSHANWRGILFVVFNNPNELLKANSRNVSDRQSFLCSTNFLFPANLQFVSSIKSIVLSIWLQQQFS